MPGRAFARTHIKTYTRTHADVEASITAQAGRRMHAHGGAERDTRAQTQSPARKHAYSNPRPFAFTLILLSCLVLPARGGRWCERGPTEAAGAGIPRVFSKQESAFAGLFSGAKRGAERFLVRLSLRAGAGGVGKSRGAGASSACGGMLSAPLRHLRASQASDALALASRPHRGLAGVIAGIFGVEQRGNLGLRMGSGEARGQGGQGGRRAKRKSGQGREWNRRLELSVKNKEADLALAMLEV